MPNPNMIHCPHCDVLAEPSLFKHKEGCTSLAFWERIIVAPKPIEKIHLKANITRTGVTFEEAIEESRQETLNGGHD